MSCAADVLHLVKPGPRYTSYPPATEFHSAFGESDAAGELARVAGDSALSLYAHVPFCRELCWYCGCNVVVTRDHSRGAKFVERLVRELDRIRDALGGGRAVAEISLGGGSPNFLPIDDLRRLLAAIYSRFELTNDHELGVELDPRTTEPAQVQALAHLGFSRMSVGVQDFAQEVQDAIHRHQSVTQTHALVVLARHAGFRTVNMDLVYGLPRQTPASFTSTLEAVIAASPDRIALFGYAHLPHLRPHQKLVERAGPLPDTAARAALFSLAVDALRTAGYEWIGMDHFAKPDDALAVAARRGELRRNFQGYVVPRGSALVGFGPSAISDTGGAYWQNAPDLGAWERAVDAGQLPVARGVALDDDDRIRRFVIERLMCDRVLDFAEVDRRFATRFETYFAHELEALRAPDCAALACVDAPARRLQTTEAGGFLIRNVAMVFDRYLRRAPVVRFSPTL